METIKRFFRVIALIWKLGLKQILELEKKALHDSLTNAYSRWYVEEVGREEVERARRYKIPFSVIMVDIFRFKDINDEFGHLKGDEILQRLVRILERGCRRSDIISRWGGDEFLVFLFHVTAVEADVVVERIKKFAESDSDPFQISCGVASWREDFSWERMTQEADAAMYHDKKKQRECEGHELQV